jgi:glycosyltransferase involved in cell wall biosynthesis
VYSTPEAYSWKFRTWYKTMQTALIRRGVPVVTVSEFSRTEIARHLPVQAGQVSVMPEGGDHVQRIVPDAGTMRQFGLEPGRYVLAVGNLAAHKNLSALALLAERLHAQEMRLVVAGNVLGRAFSGTGAQHLPTAAHYIGRVTDSQLKALYKAACCFVFPSRYEGFGLPAVEAMASGCPMVAASIPALHETCGEAALYCDPASPDHIAVQVLRVCSDPALQSRLRAAGERRAAGMTWQRAALALRDIISSHYGGRA